MPASPAPARTRRVARPRPVTRALALVAAAAVLLLGLPVPPSAQAAVTADVIKIVQLGDSYSAGNGAEAYYGPDGCFRSHDSWAAQYSEWLADQGHHVTFVSRACSGGVLSELSGTRNMGGPTLIFPAGMTEEQVRSEAEIAPECTEPDLSDYTRSFTVSYSDSGSVVVCDRVMRPQRNAVGKDTDVVVLTIGGNDLGFADIVKQCFAMGFRDPGTCRTNVESARSAIAEFQSSLEDTLTDLHARMRPDAKIVLLSYPYLSTADSYVLRSLKDRLPWVSGDSYDVSKAVRDLGAEGDTAQRAAVDAANDSASTPFVTYVDGVKEVFAGHEPDPSPHNRNPDRWIHEFDTLTMDEWYHPTATGHQKESELLRAVDVPGRPTSATAGSIDLVFVVDTTGSMGGLIEQVKQYTTAMVDLLEGSTGSYRFALVTYGDDPAWTLDPTDYAARVDLPFTTDAEEIRAALATMSAYGGGDWPETALSGLDTAISLPWRPGVKKVAVIMGDAPAHDPEPISGLTSGEVVAHSLAVDPVEVYPLSVSGTYLGDSLRDVAERTGGLPVTATSDVAEQLTATITAAMDKPYAWVDGPWTAKVGTTLTLDARGSYATTGTLVEYAWDLDSDGVTDVTTTTPTLEHRFDGPVDSVVSVQVTDDHGRSSLASTHVTITDDGDDIRAAFDTCPDVADPGQADSDGDGTGDACDSTPLPAPPVTDTVVFGPDELASVATGSLSGTVRSAGGAVAGVAVQVTGVDAGGQAVSVTATSAPDGTWIASGLLPGTYALAADGSTGARTGVLAAGSGDGSDAGAADGAGVGAIVLSGLGTSATGYVFTVAEGATTGPTTPTTPTPGGAATGGAAPTDATVANGGASAVLPVPALTRAVRGVLAATGVTGVLPLVGLGAGLLAAGLGAVAVARWSRRRSEG